MNEMARDERLAQRQPRRQAPRVGKVGASGPVALALQGLLALGALCAGPAAAEAPARQVTASAPDQTSIAALKR